MKKFSIGIRLTLWYLSIFAAAQLFFGLTMWIALHHHLYGIADKALMAQVDDVANLLREQKPKNRNVPKLQEEVSEAYVGEHSGDYLQIYDQDSNWIFRSTFLEQNQIPPIAPSLVKNRSLENIVLAHRPFRLITQRIDVNGRAYTVQTALPIDEIVATLSIFQRNLLMLAPLVLLAAAGVGYWISRKALSPVDAITRTARTISGTNLTARLDKLGTGDELQRLSDTLNEMLGRIEAAFLRVTQFTADASHELRTPISLIRTEAEIALRKSRTNTEYREALQQILMAAERTSSLVEELLTLARADAGRESLYFAPLNLSAIMNEISSEWRPLVEARSLEYRENIVEAETIVLADPTAIRRLLFILLDNAVKYTHSPGVIEIRFESCANYALVAVKDTGIGIAEHDQTRIFERFYRVDKARSRSVGGAGIGLAIADWIVRQHRGTIKVQSSVGNGTTFYIELPLQSALPQIASPKEDSTIPMDTGVSVALKSLDR
jgi:heavy metal sensor kinase